GADAKLGNDDGRDAPPGAERGPLVAGRAGGGADWRLTPLSRDRRCASPSRPDDRSVAMKRWLLVLGIALLAIAPAAIRAATRQATADTSDPMIVDGDVGRTGGSLVVAARAEPKTFNPIAALDAPSRDVIWRMHADLIHINRETQRTEPALARSWTVSSD